LALTAFSAQADPSESDAALAHGVALRRERKDAEALSEFRRAYSLEPTPRALAQIALAEAALERWVTAENDLLRALAGSDAWIERQRSALRVALEEVQSHLGTLELTSRDGAEVWIDGEFAARLPVATIRARAGHLVIEVRAAGFLTARREIALAPSTTARESIVLEPEPAPPPESPAASNAADAAPRPTTPASPVVGRGGEAGTALPPPARPPSLVMPLVLGGVGTAGLITGAAFGIQAINLKGQYDRQCASGCTNLPRDQFDAANKTHQDAQTAGTVATVAFVAGGISLAAGVAWWWVDHARANRRASVRALPLVGREMTGLMLEGEL
jgi:hypothetical protein